LRSAGGGREEPGDESGAEVHLAGDWRHDLQPRRSWNSVIGRPATRPDDDIRPVRTPITAHSASRPWRMSISCRCSNGWGALGAGAASSVKFPGLFPGGRAGVGEGGACAPEVRNEPNEPAESTIWWRRIEVLQRSKTMASAAASVWRLRVGGAQEAELLAASGFQHQPERGGISTPAALSAVRLDMVDAVLLAMLEHYAPVGGDDVPIRLSP
jgi:hypothetical protein